MFCNFFYSRRNLPRHVSEFWLYRKTPGIVTTTTIIVYQNIFEINIYTDFHLWDLVDTHIILSRYFQTFQLFIYF